MLKQAKDLLSFKAFKPLKGDMTIPLAERFYKEGPIMGVSLSKTSVTCAEISFHNKTEITISKVRTFFVSSSNQEQQQKERTKAIDKEKINVITIFAQEHGLSYVVLLNSPEIQIVKLDVSSNKIGIDRLHEAMYSIGDLLTEDPEEGRVYAYVSNQKFEETLVFSYSQDKLDESVDSINGAGLEVVRAGCSIYGTIDYLMNDKPEFFSLDQILLIYSNDCLLMASICEARFQQISFRANIENSDVESYIPRMIERLEHKQTQISYINCSDWDLESYFKLNYPSLKTVPIFENSFEGVFLGVSHG